MGPLGQLFDQSGFMPHGMCITWRPDILGLHVGSDTLIALSYFAIPGFLFVLSRRRDDLLPRWALHLFITFILLCGLTHVAAVWVIWSPNYMAEGLVKLITALVSLTTAVLVWLALKDILAIPGRGELERLNASLRQEIAERERTEESLRKAEQFLRAVLDTAQSGIVTCNAEGAIIQSNPASRKFFGISDISEDELGRVGWHRGIELFDADGKTALEDESRPLYQAFHTGTLSPTEIVVAPRGGDRRTLLARGQAMTDDDGRKFGAVVSMEDITDIRKAQEDLRILNAELEARVEARTAELERSNAELGIFAYVASHDLQEPLRQVSGFCELLRQRYGGKLDSEADEYIEFAVDGAARMQALVRDILAYSQAGRAARAPVAVDLGDALDRALMSLRSVIDSTEARIEANGLPNVMGDLRQLEQLLQNLVGNALKYRSEGSPEIKIDARKNGSMWQISISDNGIGFDPEYSDRIFQTFQRLHTHAAYPGTGIGLAICRRIIENHGGEIWAESAEGEGSTFHFTLPVAG